MMKTLMFSTALVAATAFGATAHAHAFDPEARADIRADAPAFLSSTFTGMTVYTLDPADATAMPDPTASGDAGYQRSRSVGYLADRDNWDDIGSISDIVMTKDGEIRGVLVDVGGFLGLGAHTVMVDIGELSFVADDSGAAGLDDFFIVISKSREDLEALPEWDEDQLRDGDAARGDRARTEASTEASAAARADYAEARTEASASAGEGSLAAQVRDVFSDEYETLEREERTAERLIDADVYDAAGDKVGSVNDVVLNGDDSVEGLLVDVGGFLGLGAHTVNLPIDRAEIGWKPADEDVRVQVSLTRTELEAMPEYDG
ncbi:MAG: PRC-barrel domain-containing protein [Oceanicaulis sp.]|nr:PRC-barrel domain-containing protein [Oceanicaulis sp.]